MEHTREPACLLLQMDGGFRNMQRGEWRV